MKKLMFKYLPVIGTLPNFSDMLVGYMRVSSDNDRQTTDLQRDALLDAGVDPRQLFADKASGARDDRPGLQQALAYVQRGDCLVVWKLDRLGRSLPHLLQIVTTLQAQGVAFRSLTEQMDTTTPQGAFLFSVFGARSYWIPGSYVTSNSMSAGSNALPRLRTLCTNSKNPRYSGSFSWEMPRCGRTNSARATRSLPSYSHGLHKSHRHLHLE